MALAVVAGATARVKKDRLLVRFRAEKSRFVRLSLIWLFVVYASAFLCFLIVYANNTLHFLA